MKVELIFTLCSLIFASATILITILCLLVLINKLRQNPDTVTLLLTNTYLAMFTFALVVLIVDIEVIEIDLNTKIEWNESNLNQCRIQGFLLFLTFGLVNMGFMIQGFFRFMRVIYPKVKTLQALWFNCILAPFVWSSYTCVLLPSYFWPHATVYELLTDNHYCGIPYVNKSPIIYTTVLVYMFPNTCLACFYARLIYYVRYQTVLMRQRRQIDRDIIVSRRILITLNAIATPCLCNFVFAIMTMKTPSISGSYYMYRTQWMSAIFSVFISVVYSLFSTPQLKELLSSKLLKISNRIQPAQQRQDIQIQGVQNQRKMQH